MPEELQLTYRETLSSIVADADLLFRAMATEVRTDDEPMLLPSREEVEYFWSRMPDNLKSTSEVITTKTMMLCSSLAELTRKLPLAGDEDSRDLKLAAKRIRSALRLRKFYFRSAELMHDEGTVMGFRPAEQSEGGYLAPLEASREFNSSVRSIESVLKLIEASPQVSTVSPSLNVSESARYNSGTAFIMMWMDNDNPELVDVLDAIRSVFASFGITAVRADDIEHEGLITDRVLNEIKVSEFLFADLSGARPNVYYEIGYAHALGKRVILFRKTGTGIHFDLAGYNCPEYENIRSLREKLTRRLIEVTNCNPSTVEH